jgi:uncharacterized protein (TIGR02996 family)
VTTLDDLLRVVSEGPDDTATWMLLSDWMQQRGDPRGELIALDLALEAEQGGRREPLAGRRAELLAAQAPALLGDTFAKVVAEGYGTVVWRRGFVDQVIYTGSRTMYRHQRAVGWVVRLMVEHYEPFTFTRDIRFTRTDLASVGQLARFAHLERLDICGTRVADLTPLAALPRLRHVDAVDCDLAKGTVRALAAARPDIAVRHHSQLEE